MADDKKLIWIADDGDAKKVMIIKMRDKGREFTLFDGPDEIIAAIKSGSRPDLIITDAQMPEISDGMKVLKAAKEAGIKAVMYTGTVTAALKQEAATNGASMVFDKNDQANEVTLKEYVNRLFPPLDIQKPSHSR